MASYTISPIWGAGAQLFDNSGNVLTGGKVYTYYAGTTTPLTTYTTPTGSVANSNPIIANAAGRLTNEIWLPVSGAYKFVLKDANDVLIATYDNIPTIPQPPIVNDASSVAYDTPYVVTAGNFTVGAEYLITSVGTTDFIAIGAAANITGIHFTATGVGSGTGEAQYTRYVNEKLSEVVSVKDFGATGDGVTDDADSILAAFEYIKSNGSGTLDFTNDNGDAVYTISYGFRVPTNCVIKLNGCTVQATTTFGQGTLPSSDEAISSAFFKIGRPDSESPLANYLENISFIGDGAVLDGRRDEQTGTPGGYTAISMETTDTPVQADNLKIRNIVIENITINNPGYDGVYIQGVQNLYIDNVIVNEALRIGFTGINGYDVTFNNCQANYTIGDNPSAPTPGPSNSGDGFWNEPNATWQDITRWSYVNCRAVGNYRSGFKVWNAGQDANYYITLDNCYSYSNVYDAIAGALRSSPGEAGFIINTNPTSASEAMVVFNNCVAERENGSGFIINPSGGGGGQQFILNNCVTLNCNINNTDSVNRTPIRINSVAYTATPKIVISNPTIIAPNGNSLGYGIYVGSLNNVYVNNPKFINTFTQGLVVDGTNSPADDEREQCSIDLGSQDNNPGLIPMKFLTPLRFPVFDQTAAPDTITDLFKGEMVVWQDDNNVCTGIYKVYNDTNDQRYVNLTTKKTLRATLEFVTTSTVAANATETHVVSVPGAASSDFVQVSMGLVGGGLTTGLILTGKVTAADQVTVVFNNATGGSLTRENSVVYINVTSYN